MIMWEERETDSVNTAGAVYFTEDHLKKLRRGFPGTVVGPGFSAEREKFYKVGKGRQYPSGSRPPRYGAISAVESPALGCSF